VRNPLPPLVAERLPALRERPIDPTEKGFGPLATAGLPAAGLPAAGGGVTAAGLAAARPALHAAGFTYPLLTLRESALANNIEAMAAYCDRADAGALDVAKAVAATDTLRVAGVAGYEAG
jgi:hypothetical protein